MNVFVSSKSTVLGHFFDIYVEKHGHTVVADIDTSDQILADDLETVKFAVELVSCPVVAIFLWSQDVDVTGIKKIMENRPPNLKAFCVLKAPWQHAGVELDGGIREFCSHLGIPLP